VKSQLETILDAFPVRFAKTGMLANCEIIRAVAETVPAYGLQLVVDPVMVSTSGAKLLENSAVSAMQELLFPLASWLTPNIPEAELICRCNLHTTDDLAHAAVTIFEKFRCNVILKSGHAITSDKVTDIICFQGKLFTLSSPVVEIKSNTAHGTGCTLSAAVAANLALGRNWQDAVMSAKAFVYGSLFENTALSETLSQMYPPVQSYVDRVILKEY
jgi:hydroxymethylpyrimidine/phosphomethylpyrimidine kinase